MDDSRFDALARSLASPSRRAMLSSLATALVGGVLGLRTEDAEAHDLAARCKKLKGAKKKKCLKKSKKHRATHVPPPPPPPPSPPPPPPECTAPEDCPQPSPSQPCGQRACVDGTCGIGPRNASTLCRAETGPCDVEERCDGASLTCPADQLRPSTQSCGPPQGCSGTFFQSQTFCSGESAACPNNPAQDCDPYTCTGTGCRSTCFDDNHCVNSHYCNGTACVPQQPLGSGCTRGRQCLSNSCVNNVCCSSPSCPVGQTCTGGTCHV